jgi:serine carboxypeptidase-like clade 1
LNGGPGCSSLDGFLYENGPWNWVGGPDNTTLVKSPTSWNRLAHMIYLESPAGVGFSYSDTPSDYFTANDTRTADDAFRFLVQWFSDFPEYKNYKFYVAYVTFFFVLNAKKYIFHPSPTSFLKQCIDHFHFLFPSSHVNNSGESFAGIYVPTLANRIVTGNQRGESNINLVGIAVGNGVTDPIADSDTNNLFPFAYGHALYSTQTNDAIKAACPSNPSGTACQALTEQVYSVFNNDLLNMYDIYGDCYRTLCCFFKKKSFVFHSQLIPCIFHPKHCETKKIANIHTYVFLFGCKHQTNVL